MPNRRHAITYTNDYFVHRGTFAWYEPGYEQNHTLVRCVRYLLWWIWCYTFFRNWSLIARYGLFMKKNHYISVAYIWLVSSFTGFQWYLRFSFMLDGYITHRAGNIQHFFKDLNQNWLWKWLGVERVTSRYLKRQCALTLGMIPIVKEFWN